MTRQRTIAAIHASLAEDLENSRDSSRALTDARRYARENRERLDAEWDALPSPPRTIAQHLKEGVGQ